MGVNSIRNQTLKRKLEGEREYYIQSQATYITKKQQQIIPSDAKRGSIFMEPLVSHGNTYITIDI